MTKSQHDGSEFVLDRGDVTCLRPRRNQFVPENQNLDGEPENQEEWRSRQRSLEQWICELLIENQRLRMSVESLNSPWREKSR